MAMLLGPAATAGQHKVDPCGERYDRVLARNQHARLEYGEDIGLGSGYREPYQLTCAPRTKHVVQLDLGQPSVLGQAVSLNGRYVGYVSESCENDEGPVCQTDLLIQGVVRFADSRDTASFTVDEDPDRSGYASVPSLRITSRGALAFIACRDTYRREGVIRAHCKHPGRPSRVFAYPSDTDKRLTLDRGRGIDPDSMRRRGDVISWRHGSKVRRVRLH